MNQRSDKKEKFLDSIYQNRATLLRYFLWVIACTLLRYGISVLFGMLFSLPTSDAELLSWVVWAPLFYVTLKYFVFKTRSEHIYALLKQIIIYILCIFVLWLTRQLFIGVLYVISKNAAVSASLGGAVNEILCLLLMYKRVFK